MQLENHTFNEFGKCDTPENTTARIRAALDKLDIELEWRAGVKLSESLSWASASCPCAQLSSNGKGITPEMTEASVYAELVERLGRSSQWGSLTLCSATQGFVQGEWLKGHVHAFQQDLEPNCVRLEDMLRDREDLSTEDLDAIKRFELSRVWVDGYSLVQRRTLKVPVMFAEYIDGSNGLASGNTLEEAIIHGACEVFERYASRELVYGRVLPTVDPASIFEAPVEESTATVRAGSAADGGMAAWRAQCLDAVREAWNYCGENHVEVLVKDLSLGGLLPCVGILTTNHSLEPNHVEYHILQPAASFCMEEALTRCFTERMQGCLDFRPRYDRDVQKDAVDFGRFFRERVTESDISFLEDGPVVPFRRFPHGETATEIDQVISICKELNTDCVVVDMTHPLIRFPVVRVTMPGVSGVKFFSNPPLALSRERAAQGKRILESFFARPEEPET